MTPPRFELASVYWGYPFWKYYGLYMLPNLGFFHSEKLFTGFYFPKKVSKNISCRKIFVVQCIMVSWIPSRIWRPGKSPSVILTSSNVRDFLRSYWKVENFLSTVLATDVRMAVKSFSSTAADSRIFLCVVESIFFYSMSADQIKE